MSKCRQFLSSSYSVGCRWVKLKSQTGAGKLFRFDPLVRSSGILHDKLIEGNLGMSSIRSYREDNEGEYLGRSKQQVYIRSTDDDMAHSLVRYEKETLSKLLSFIEEVNPRDFNSRSIDIALRIMEHKITELRRGGSKGIKEIGNTLGMQKFLRIIKAKAHTFDSHVLLSSFKLFSLLDCPGSNPAFEQVTKLILSKLGTLELPQILFLHNMLRLNLKDSKSSLLDALRYALPAIIESQSSSRLSELRCSDLLDLMKTAVVGKWSQTATVNILENLLDKDFTSNKLPELMKALQVLADASQRVLHHERVGQIVESLLKEVTTRVDQMHYSELDSVILACSIGALRGRNSFYNEDFLEKAVHRILEIADLDGLCRTAKRLGKIGYLNVDLLETCAESIASDPSCIYNTNSLKFYDTVLGFANLNYTPDNWESLKPLFLDCAENSQRLHGRDLTLTVSLLVLGILPPKLLSEKFTDLQDIDKFGAIDHTKIVTIYNALKLFPEYDGPIPSREEIEMFSESVRNRSKYSYPLQSTLEMGLGGEGYLLSGVFHDGIHIDHCIVMRQGGYPILLADVPINLSSLDQILRPDNSELILIKVLQPSAYLRNMDRPTGIPTLEKKILDTIGHCICINITEWENLDPGQKVPYIMQRIHEHVGSAGKSFLG